MDELGGIYARSVPDLDAIVQVGVASGKVIQCSFPETPAANAEDRHDLMQAELKARGLAR